MRRKSIVIREGCQHVDRALWFCALERWKTPGPSRTQHGIRKRKNHPRTSVQDDWEEEVAEDIVEDEEPLVGLLAGADEEEPEEDEYEHEEVEEWESIALNAMADLEGSQDIDASSLGESIQLQIAALAAFGKAKGKKGKGKGKGKVIKSGLTLAQRRAKLQEIKSKSRCMRCGATGHWAGDPACKFPGARKPSPSNGPSQKGSSPQARMAM